ncbi:MAG: non-canonical purine NTP pyrophosphatase, partial [Candidatus Bipolaricaulota bacterium]|nr:non-canonical purine NTP pyrophosphatase [Candidatus Bipolaricaulota bacterium]
MILLLGSKNPGKIDEFKRLLVGVPRLRLLTCAEHPFSSVSETGATFLENALIKARTICAEAKIPVLAEDAGLEVAALDGAPGILSARFSGAEKDYARNNERLLARMGGVVDRRARFVSAIALRLPSGGEFTARGILSGKIAAGLAGMGGFGYDPLFIPDGYSRTLGELSAREK